MLAGSSQRVYVRHLANSPFASDEVSVEEHDKDQSVLAHIQRLVAEEHRLQQAPDGGKRLTDVQVELDQCWDLLRQRRALRETGGDPSQAHARPAEVVKKYIG